MKPDEIILIKQRCAPFRGKLKMDWDTDFGFGRGVDHYGKMLFIHKELWMKLKHLT